MCNNCVAIVVATLPFSDSKPKLRGGRTSLHRRQKLRRPCRAAPSRLTSKRRSIGGIGSRANIGRVSEMKNNQARYEKKRKKKKCPTPNGVLGETSVPAG